MHEEAEVVVAACSRGVGGGASCERRRQGHCSARRHSSLKLRPTRRGPARPTRRSADGTRRRRWSQEHDANEPLRSMDSDADIARSTMQNFTAF